MKYDELKAYTYDDMLDGNADVDIEYYPKSEVDAAIAELKEVAEDACLERDDNSRVIDELEAENRKLKRALWLARAERASDRARIFYFCDLDEKLDIDGFSYDSKKKKCCKKMAARLWRITWLKIERKCRAKAKEYK